MSASQGSVIDPTIHARLLQTMPSALKDAGILERHLLNSMRGVCSPNEIQWVLKFKNNVKHGVSGFLYLGKDTDGVVLERMSLIAGALTRNYILARVLTLQRLLRCLKEGEAPAGACILVPNFFLGKHQGGGLVSHWAVLSAGLSNPLPDSSPFLGGADRPFDAINCTSRKSGAMPLALPRLAGSTEVHSAIRQAGNLDIAWAWLRNQSPTPKPAPKYSAARRRNHNFPPHPTGRLSGYASKLPP